MIQSNIALENETQTLRVPAQSAAQATMGVSLGSHPLGFVTIPAAGNCVARAGPAIQPTAGRPVYRLAQFASAISAQRHHGPIRN